MKPLGANQITIKLIALGITSVEKRSFSRGPSAECFECAGIASGWMEADFS